MPTDGSALPDPKPRMRGGIGRKKPGVPRQIYGTARTMAFVRAAGLCEAHTPECFRYGTQTHHVLPRSRGGKHELGNLLVVCASCHGWIHAHPAISRQAGWLK